MKNQKLRGNHLKKIGYTNHNALSLALTLAKKYMKRETFQSKLDVLTEILVKPEAFRLHAEYGVLAEMLLPILDNECLGTLVASKPYTVFGTDGISESAKNQMYVAMKLPIAVSGALMPDAHHGYGLPIGGVLATENSVIPYGVGMDIGCRMSLSLFDASPAILKSKSSELLHVLKQNTCFGIKETFDKAGEAAVLERSEFREIPIVKTLHQKAYKQLGSSGGGNHFVEFGLVSITSKTNLLNVEPGEYLALLSHSGSRGLGAGIAQHFTQVARSIQKLPKEAQHLAWLDLNSEAGQQYWLAMQLAGDYAAACHDEIHKRISKALKINTIQRIENHHNFAWKEVMEDGREVIVHRKGATPAGKDVLGIIPGSMTQPGFIVAGKGNFKSLLSASHGAGRSMSRSKAKGSITVNALKESLKKASVQLIGGGVDEAPMAYKDIQHVMREQLDLVDVLGTFTPKLVRMSR